MKKIQMVNFWVFLGKWVSRYKRVFLVNLVGFFNRESTCVCKGYHNKKRWQVTQYSRWIDFKKLTISKKGLIK